MIAYQNFWVMNTISPAKCEGRINRTLIDIVDICFIRVDFGDVELRWVSGALDVPPWTFAKPIQHHGTPCIAALPGSSLPTVHLR